MESAALNRISNLASFDSAIVNDLSVYVATTKAQRQSGLAGLTTLDKDGMLFVYDIPSYVAFTMAEMKFDLDISFYDANGDLLRKGTFNAGYAGPVFCHGYSYVLETPAGLGQPEKLDVAAVKKDSADIAPTPGNNLPDAPAATSCPACGNIVPANALVCPFCGADLTNPMN